MPLQTITFNGKIYPAFTASGNAARFCRAFAQEICTGEVIYDVGYGFDDWKFPGAIGVDFKDSTGYHAMNLPDVLADAIHSSHFLEHYKGRFQDVIEYWLTRLKPDGVIFLYLPSYEHQDYWAFGNKKHVHSLTPGILYDYCEYLENNGIISGWVVSGVDLNSSFYCVIQKPPLS